MRLALSFFDPATPRDVRRATRALLGLSALCLVYGGLYGNLHLFRAPLGIGLPDVSTGAELLLSGLLWLAVLLGVWGLGLAMISAPGTAAGLQRWWHRVVAAEARSSRAVVVAAVLAALYAAARIAANAENDPSTLDALTSGTARTPFQYRALVPFAVHQMVALAPWLGEHLTVIYGVVEALAAFGAWVAMRAFLRPYVAGDARRSVAALVLFAPLALNLATPFRHNALFFPWDTLSVALFTAGLALMQQRRWALYYVLFVAATVNRETTCFLTLAFVLSQWGRVPLARLAAHGGAQFVLWVGVKAGLSLAYAANLPLHTVQGSNDLFILPYLYNLGTVSGVPGLLLLCGTMGGLWLVPAFLFPRVADPTLRRWLRVVPVFLAGMFVVGVLLEVRIYSELVPLATAALLLAVRDVVWEAAAVSGEKNNRTPEAQLDPLYVVRAGRSPQPAPIPGPREHAPSVVGAV